MQRLGFLAALGTGITQRFARVSEQINRVEQSLKLDKQQPAIAQLIRKVQLEEKEKLLLVNRLTDALSSLNTSHSN